MLLVKLFICFSVCAASVAWGQATLDETKETSVIYVDATAGLDSNPGTQQSPFKTLSKGVGIALQQSRKGTGTKVLVLPGTYRESITASSSGTVPVTIEAAQRPGGVIISGADVWTGWQVYSGNSKIYTHAWPNKWGLCDAQPGPFEQDIVRRREMIIVDKSSLTQVLSLAQMTTRTFFVDESNSIVYMWPPAGTNVNNATIEVATRPLLLQLLGVNSWAIRGLQFQYANGCRVTTPAVWVSEKSTNIIFDDDKFVWNNATGLQLTSTTYFTVSASQAYHNGQMGIFSQYSKYSSWVSDQASYNNWRGAQGAYYSWDSSGVKFGEVHNASLTGVQTLYNLGVGVHLDTDIRDITMDSLVSNGNLNSGVLLEANPGPVNITNAAICGSNVQNQPYEGGLNLVDAANVSLVGSILNGNGTSEILITGLQGGISVNDFETGATTQVYNENAFFATNTIGASTSQKVFQDGYLSQDWGRFQSSLNSDHNTWWNATDKSPFEVPGSPGQDDDETFPSWQSLNKQDSHSSFTDPGSNPTTICETTPDEPDYWLTTQSLSNSVSRGKSVTYAFTVFSLGFSKTISLQPDVSSVAGATASLSDSSISGAGSSVLTISTSSSTPAGTYPITLVGNSGSTTHTVTVSLVVK